MDGNNGCQFEDVKWFVSIQRKLCTALVLKKGKKKEEKKRRILHQPAKFPELSADQERFHSRESYQASPSLWYVSNLQWVEENEKWKMKRRITSVVYVTPRNLLCL